MGSNIKEARTVKDTHQASGSCHSGVNKLHITIRWTSEKSDDKRQDCIEGEDC